MKPAVITAPDLNVDFWPADSLAAWRGAPRDAFLSWLAGQRLLGERQFRDTSRETYCAMFSAWLSFLEARHMHLLEATCIEGSQFFNDRAAAFEPVSRRRYLQLLSKVYRYLQTVGWQGQNPLSQELMLERALEIALPPGFEPEEVQRLSDVLAGLPNWRGIRARGMAALLLGAGLRTNELIHLQMRAVHEDFTIEVHPLGVHRAHTTLMLPDAPWRTWWLAWQATRAELKIPGELAMPAVRAGAPYSPSGVFKQVQGWLVAANLVQPKQHAPTGPKQQQGANRLRNTFAQMALLSGRYSVEAVQEFLGHEETRATARHAKQVGARVAGEASVD